MILHITGDLRRCFEYIDVKGRGRGEEREEDEREVDDLWSQLSRQLEPRGVFPFL